MKERSDKRYMCDFPSYGLENSWEIVNGGCGRLYEGIYYSSRLQMLYASSTLTSQSVIIAITTITVSREQQVKWQILHI